MKICRTISIRLAFVLTALPLLMAAQPMRAAPFVVTGSMTTVRSFQSATLLSNGKLLVAGGISTNGDLAGAELFDPANGSWTATGSMTNKRDSHTATLLMNGKVLVAGGSSSGGYIPNAEIYDPVTGTWTPTGSLNTARGSHAATLLPNGKVLVAGGNSGSGYQASAEVYDPVAGTWTATNAMNQARINHTATLLANGKVLVAGGLNAGNQSVTNSELFDPASGTWTFTTGSLNTARNLHTATLLPSGKVLVAGGFHSSSQAAVASVEIFDPATQMWSQANAMANARQDHAATLLPNGKVMVTAGKNSSYLANAEIFDPAAGTWMSYPMVAARIFHTATLLPDGTVLVTGGSISTGYLASAEVYEPTNGNWTTINPMNHERYSHTLTLLTNGLVLAAGGGGNSGAITNSEVYNPVTGSWTTNGAMGAPRFEHTATLLPGGLVLAAGGYNGTNYLTNAEVYNPASGLWTATGAMNTGRAFHTATLLPNGKVLAAAGEIAVDVATNGIETYDPAAGTWTTNAPMNTARYQHTATLLPSGKVLVAGGLFSQGFGLGFTYLQSVETYDPASGTWTTNNPMNAARVDHTATLLANGKVLVTGGFNNTNNWLASAELFDPSTRTWTYTGSMNFARFYHTATLLADGQVLVTGGEASNMALKSGEIYDPATGTWVVTNTLNTARYDSAAVLLANGKALVTGGYGNGTGILTGAELFDPGLGYSNSWQPQITNLSPTLALPGNVSIGGLGFRGIAEGSGGNCGQDSAADYPLLQLRALESGESAFLTVTNWTTNALATVALTNFPAGWALATVVVDGIPSQSAFVVVKNTASVTLSNLAQTYDGTAKSVSVTTVPPGLAVNVTYNGSAAAPTNPGSYTVIALVNDANYAGGATNTLQIAGLNRNFGVDASHFQNSNGIPETNWAQMFAQSNRFAFVKATEGLTGPDDPTMATNVANATAAGLVTGVYHVAHPENRPTTNGAVMEADHFLSYTGGAIGPGMLRPVLDIETGYGTLTNSAMTDWVLAFSQEIVNNRGAGAAPIVYCTQFYANEEFDSRLAGNALWVEATGGGDPTYSNPPTNGFPSPTGVFTNWAFWQYNISGSAGGVSPIDLDVCHDELAPLNSYLIPTASANFRLGNLSVDGSGFHLSFTNVAGTHFTLLSSTNVSIALSNWTVVGAATEVSPGQFVITDAGATNLARRFYRVRSP